MALGTAGQLSHRGLGPVEGGSDLRIGESERLAQDEDRTLKRGERLEDDQHGQGHGVGEHGTFRRIGYGGAEFGDHGFGQPGPHVSLTAGPQMAKPVDGQPGGDAHEKGPRLPHVLTPGRGPAQPRFLHHILGVGDPAEHAVGDPGEGGPVGFEEIGRGVGSHPSIPSDALEGVQRESRTPLEPQATQR